MALQPAFPSSGPAPGGLDTQPRGTWGSRLLLNLSLSLDCIFLSSGGDSQLCGGPLASQSLVSAKATRS